MSHNNILTSKYCACDHFATLGAKKGLMRLFIYLFIFLPMISQRGFYDDLGQYFPVLTGKTVNIVFINCLPYVGSLFDQQD